MANSFAEGFAKSYSSKPMVDAFNKARKERESEKVFQKWKPTPEAQEMFVNMGYKNPAEVEYHDFTERIKLITAADTLQSRKNTLKANAMTLKNKLLTDYATGASDRPDEETLGSFSMSPQQAFVNNQQVPVAAPGFAQQAMKQGIWGGAVDTNKMERQAISSTIDRGSLTWKQKQHVASVKAGLKRGTGVVVKEMGELEEMPVTSYEEAMKVIQFNRFDPADFKEELEFYKNIVQLTKDKTHARLKDGTIVNMKTRQVVKE